MIRRSLPTIGALCLAFGAAAQPAAVTAFDGNWRVTLTCQPYSGRDDGAKPYRHEWPATVSNGMLEGTHGEAGQPSWHFLHGPIAADGSATLVLDGITNNPEYVMNNRERGSPYSYRVKASFEPRAGTGQRLGRRACDFRFVKM